MLPRLPLRLARAIVLFMALAASPAWAQDVDPRYRFETIRTEHFAIYFHQGTGTLARTLADIAEDEWRRLHWRDGVAPPDLTHVVFVDQSESANGFATPLPRNTVVLYAATPPPASLLNPDEWLRTLFVHEYRHIVHLDRAKGWARGARYLFGRAPWTFPNLLLPLWQIEGLATFEESVPRGATRPGRLHAGDFLALTREAARTKAIEPMNRVGGGLTDWPGGLAPYAYGLSFHHWLAGRYGAESFQRLADATAGSLPWLGTRAFKRVYGRSLGDLWTDYAADLVSRAAPPSTAASPPPRRLTRHGFQMSGPRYLPRLCADCPREIVYALRTPDDRPGLHVVDTETLETTRLATRFLGSTSAPSREGVIYFDQQERIRNSGTYSDLYAIDRRTRQVRRLTHDARLLDPDLSPDGQSLAAVRATTPGQRDLVVIDLSGTGRIDETATTTVAAAPQTQFDAPRWSPDGRRLVVGRQGSAGPSEIAIVDIATRTVDVVTSTSGMRWATPTWRPDGRAVVAAGARAEAAFNLYEVELESRTIRQLTQHDGGATWPDVATDGSTIVYAGYTASGFEVYEVPYPGSAPTVAREPAVTAATGVALAPVPATIRPYRPWSTLLPTFWTPIITTSREQVRGGAIIGGRDVLGYHSWQVSADWSVADRIDTGAAGSAPDWSASYVYGRWRPQVWGAVARQTSFFPGESEASSPETSSALEERTVEIGVQVPIRRFRFSQAMQVSIVRAVDTVRLQDTAVERNRSGARVAWRYSSAQAPGYAISPERGVTLGAAAEFIRPALGASGRAGTVTADARVYLPGLARHHVVAVRAARGFTWGDRAVGRLFVMGGGDSSLGAGSLSSETARLLRGFPSNTFAGRQVAVLNADYRFPIARPQRGVGAWPFFLHSLHGAVVADAGHVWTNAFDRKDVKTSFGVELAANVVLGHALPVTLTAGAARGHDGSGSARAAATVYGRVGYAF